MYYFTNGQTKVFAMHTYSKRLGTSLDLHVSNPNRLTLTLSQTLTLSTRPNTNHKF